VFKNAKKYESSCFIDSSESIVYATECVWLIIGALTEVVDDGHFDFEGRVVGLHGA